MSKIGTALKERQRCQRPTAMAQYHALLLRNDPADAAELQAVLACIDRTSADVGPDRARLIEARGIKAALAERPGVSQQQQDQANAITTRSREIVAAKAELDAEMQQLEIRHGELTDRLAAIDLKGKRLLVLRQNFGELLDVDPELVGLAERALSADPDDPDDDDDDDDDVDPLDEMDRRTVGRPVT